MDGGDGNDNLTSNAAAGIIIGGMGDDSLSAAGVRDILIGGLGADRLVGNGGDDILIAGFTSYDSGTVDDKLANDAVLMKLLEEWTSSRAYATRVANLRAGTGPVLGGTGRSLSAGVTVFNDTAVDQLTGSSGMDWFFFDATRDKVTDKASTESAN
jgi:Ca2+-binding RTX toxin-like protein